jgi:hypothetical protein
MTDAIERHQAMWREHRAHQAARAKHLPPPGNASTRRTPTAVAPHGSNADRLLLVKLEADLHRLSLQPSREVKTRIQGELLNSPTYADYLTRAQAGKGLQGDDPLLIRCMIWAFNTGAIDKALQLADTAMQRGYTMPDDFKANVEIFVAREIAYWSLAQQKAGRDPQPHLDHIWQRSRHWEKPDQIEARLHKAKAQATEKTDPAQALKLYQRADELDQGIGVTNAIKRLKKLLE